jgi:hypothetical protein
MSRKSFAAALLLVALSAHAQVEIRPTLARPSAPGIFALPPSVLLAPAPALAPLTALVAPPALAPSAVAAASPAAAAPAAGALPPAQARAAAMSGALADFARTDLKTASSGESRDAGETLMLRALGASAPDFAAASVLAAESAVPSLAAPGRSGPRAEPKVYLLSKPLHETVSFGPLSIALHLAYSVIWEGAKGVIAYKATGSVAAAATLCAFELAWSPVMITARSLADLGQRYWRRRLAVLKELARAPGVDRVKVLTTGDVTFLGPLARRKDNTGLIFVEADGELPETLGRFGAPIPLGDTASTRVRLAFVHRGGTSAVTWTPTLKDLLDRRPIPPETAAAWRAETKGAKPALKKILDVTKGKARIEATLIGADGRERTIGAVAEGPAARKLIGLGKLDRIRALMGLALPSRAIPLSDTVVERPGDARETGLKAALLRAWRRLTGRLIVAKNWRISLVGRYRILS